MQSLEKYTLTKMKNQLLLGYHDYTLAELFEIYIWCMFSKYYYFIIIVLSNWMFHYPGEVEKKHGTSTINWKNNNFSAFINKIRFLLRMKSFFCILSKNIPKSHTWWISHRYLWYSYALRKKNKWISERRGKIAQFIDVILVKTFLKKKTRSSSSLCRPNKIENWTL